MPFKSGNEWNGNKNGRPRKPEIDLIREAIDEVSIVKKKSLWRHLIEKCYEDNSVLVAVARKFMPEQINAVDGEGKSIPYSIVVMPAQNGNGNHRETL